MAAHHGTMAEYAPSQETWSEYIKRLELYFVANDVDATMKKRAILLNACGSGTYKLIRNLAAPAKPCDVDNKALVELMASAVVERFRFPSRSQQQGESIADVFAQLQRLSEHCQFGETRQEMLRDRLVCGVRNTSIQRKLLAETDFTLDKALSTARAMETAERNTRALRMSQPTEETDVHNVRNRRSNTAQPGGGGVDSGPCSRCGAKSHTPADCRWKSAVCHACRHLARMCRSKQQQSASAARPQQGSGTQSGSRPTRSQHRRIQRRAV